MWIWIIVGVVAVLGVAYAFWPRASGPDARIRRAGAISQSRASNYNNTSGPNSGGAGGL